jgi:ribosomal protein S17
MKNEKITKNPIVAYVVSVLSDTKTVKVRVPRIVVDAKYGKRLHRHTTLLVDAAGNSNLSVDAVVKIAPCRKLSKRKAWKIVSSETAVS